MKKIFGLLVTVLVFLVSCNNPLASKPATGDMPGISFDTILPKHSTNTNWLEKFDLDGDKINDRISFDYSGGAHCCYQINIALSSNQQETKFPFEMDGGYVGGVDNSQPDKFDIRNIDQDSLPEILMRIQTYNGQAKAIPEKWKAEYGIKTNYIVIEYNQGKLTTADYRK